MGNKQAFERSKAMLINYVNYNSRMSGSRMKSKCHLFFETLATKLKMGIIAELEQRPLSVNEITSRVKEERSKVSHALLSLEECGFVQAKEKGRQRVYSLNKETMAPILKLVGRHVKKHCKVCRKK